MRVRLFWKILLGFWATFVLATAAIVLTISLQTPKGLDLQRAPGQLRSERELAAAVALQYGGASAVRQVVAAWPPAERSRLRMQRRPDGQLTVRLADPPSPPPPMWPLAMEFAASLLFSAALAAYITRPIGRLRGGFSALAGGALRTRLGPGVGRRRDEIADLAKDFDTMAERLEQLVTSRDRLLHDVSHELRSPLARLSVAVGLARQNPERAGEVLDRIETEGRRLNTLVGDLLSLSRAEAGVSRDRIYFDLGELLAVTCADARFEAQPRGIGVDLAMDESLTDPARAPLVAGEPELIRRALENVVRNALRFSPTGSCVQINASLEVDVIRIDVRDHGPGAAPEVRASLFDPFVKGVGQAAGAGLGLAIARRALLAHEGQIEAHSPDDGGMLVRITLPTVRPSRAPEPAGS